ncbi:hypothetical protein GQX74_001486 [Glossina fuscipes]|nr:hypothetical protein GQX74_001486 [Glossina fuscipes]
MKIKNYFNKVHARDHQRSVAPLCPPYRQHNDNSYRQPLTANNTSPNEIPNGHPRDKSLTVFLAINNNNPHWCLSAKRRASENNSGVDDELSLSSSDEYDKEENATPKIYPEKDGKIRKTKSCAQQQLAYHIRGGIYKVKLPPISIQLCLQEMVTNMK